MSQLGKVRIGHKAPDFRCDAVINGLIEEKSLSSYISPSKPQWLILLFIPAAFSFVCPTEVLAFQNCFDEFRDRNCNVVFVSVDTKHSLWHWQNVPRQYGGLGQIDIALLSDPSHKMSREYGVLIEEEGVCLRGLFIIDDKAIVQQVTLNNLTVGRSVLEALRLLEAFQAVAKHGVLCPIDWKPSANTSETINTISNTLTESYEERLANLQKEFGDAPLTDLDVKHKSEVGTPAATVTPTPTATSAFAALAAGETRGSASTTSMATRSADNLDNIGVTMTYNAPGELRDDVKKQRVKELEDAQRTPISTPAPPIGRLSRRFTDDLSWTHTMPAPAYMPATLVLTPPQVGAPPPTPKKPGFGGTARYSRGHTTTLSVPHTHGASQTALHKPNTFESRSGTQVILEFADPTSSPQGSPHSQSLSQSPFFASGYPDPYFQPPLSRSYSHNSTSPSTPSPSLSRSGGQMSARMASSPVASAMTSARGTTQSRMQATFEAIKKVSSGLTTPMFEFTPRKSGSKREEGKGSMGEGDESGKELGFFDVVPEVVEA